MYAGVTTAGSGEAVDPAVAAVAAGAPTPPGAVPDPVHCCATDAVATNPSKELPKILVHFNDIGSSGLQVRGGT
jgi:hypothetical protein